MNVYKNFLNKEELNKLEVEMMGSRMPWYYNDEVVEEGDGHFQFTYTFVREGKLNCEDKAINILNPFITKLKMKKIFRIKANLTLKTKKHIEHGFHVDYDLKNIKTGIFYLNTCNGYTKFKNNKKIKSEKNKYVEFDCNTLHTSSTCTDKKRRVVINFNYTS